MLFGAPSGSARPCSPRHAGRGRERRSVSGSRRQAQHDGAAHATCREKERGGAWAGAADRRSTTVQPVSRAEREREEERGPEPPVGSARPCAACVTRGKREEKLAPEPPRARRREEGLSLARVACRWCYRALLGASGATWSVDAIWSVGGTGSWSVGATGYRGGAWVRVQIVSRREKGRVRVCHGVARAVDREGALGRFVRPSS